MQKLCGWARFESNSLSIVFSPFWPVALASGQLSRTGVGDTSAGKDQYQLDLFWLTWHQFHCNNLSYCDVLTAFEHIIKHVLVQGSYISSNWNSCAISAHSPTVRSCTPKYIRSDEIQHVTEPFSVFKIKTSKSCYDHEKKQLFAFIVSSVVILLSSHSFPTEEIYHLCITIQIKGKQTEACKSKYVPSATKAFRNRWLHTWLWHATNDHFLRFKRNSNGTEIWKCSNYTLKLTFACQSDTRMASFLCSYDWSFSWQKATYKPKQLCKSNTTLDEDVGTMTILSPVPESEALCFRTSERPAEQVVSEGQALLFLKRHCTTSCWSSLLRVNAGFFACSEASCICQLHADQPSDLARAMCHRRKLHCSRTRCAWIGLALWIQCATQDLIRRIQICKRFVPLSLFHLPRTCNNGEWTIRFSTQCPTNTQSGGPPLRICKAKLALNMTYVVIITLLSARLWVVVMLICNALSPLLG